MIDALFWISIVSGGILILLMLLSVAGGLELEADIDTVDTDADGSGLGIIKGLLTFIAVASWVVRMMINAEQHPFMAIGIGLAIGVCALWLLNFLWKLLLNNEENVNWTVDDALFQTGQVYLKIPGGNNVGIVHLKINGATRELKAKSVNQEEIPTGTPIVVYGIENNLVLVQTESFKP